MIIQCTQQLKESKTLHVDPTQAPTNMLNFESTRSHPRLRARDKKKRGKKIISWTHSYVWWSTPIFTWKRKA